jgi:hypothetical protein
MGDKAARDIFYAGFDDALGQISKDEFLRWYNEMLSTVTTGSSGSLDILFANTSSPRWFLATLSLKLGINAIVVFIRSSWDFWLPLLLCAWICILVLVRPYRHQTDHFVELSATTSLLALVHTASYHNNETIPDYLGRTVLHALLLIFAATPLVVRYATRWMFRSVGPKSNGIRVDKLNKDVQPVNLCSATTHRAGGAIDRRLLVLTGESAERDRLRHAMTKEIAQIGFEVTGSNRLPELVKMGDGDVDTLVLRVLERMRSADASPSAVQTSPQPRSVPTPPLPSILPERLENATEAGALEEAEPWHAESPEAEPQAEWNAVPQPVLEPGLESQREAPVEPGHAVGVEPEPQPEQQEQVSASHSVAAGNWATIRKGLSLPANDVDKALLLLRRREELLRRREKLQRNRGVLIEANPVLTSPLHTTDIPVRQELENELAVEQLDIRVDNFVHDLKKLVGEIGTPERRSRKSAPSLNASDPQLATSDILEHT